MPGDHGHYVNEPTDEQGKVIKQLFQVGQSDEGNAEVVDKRSELAHALTSSKPGE